MTMLRNKTKKGLALKLVISLVGSLVIAFGVISIFEYLYNLADKEEQVVDNAELIAETVNSSLRHFMLNEQCLEAYGLIDSIAKTSNIKKIRMFDASGEIRHSTDADEIRADNADSLGVCASCHQETESNQLMTFGNSWRILDDVDDSRILRYVNHVYNEDSCSTIACHPGVNEAAVLGVLDVDISLLDVDNKLMGYQNTKMLFYVVSMVIVVIVSLAFVIFMVDKPVRLLLNGIDDAAKGDLSTSVDLQRNDELGQLADSFNAMISDLRTARDEITNWAETLEHRVEEKSKKLKSAQDQIVRAEKMASMGKLAAIVAHEINNPLTGILTYSKLLQKRIEQRIVEQEKGEKMDFSDCMKFSKVIENEASRCGDIVKNLLMFSKKSTIHFELNDFNELLSRSVQLVNHVLELQGIDLETSFADNIPGIVCDAGQIQQIFVALMMNSIESIGEQGKISLFTYFEETSEKVHFKIDDNGAGMDKETLNRVFEPFYSTKEESGGSGLGLTVVYGIVERHGADIVIKSKPGQGTSVRIMFPLKPPKRENIPEVPESTHPEKI